MLDEVKEEVAAALLRERRASKMAAKAAQAFLDLLKAGRSMTEVTLSEEEAREKPNASKPTRRDTPWILKTQKSIPRIGESEELHAAAFALSEAQPIASSVYEVNRAYFVVALKERETPDLKKFEEEKESLQRSAVAVKQGRVLRSWVSHLRDNAVITYNEQLFPPLVANSPEGKS
jgi:hypothetical protein